MGLLRGMARTAVVAGTATAVSNNVSRRQAARWSEREASAQADAADQQAYQTTNDASLQLQQLASLREQGILTDEEFAAKKKQLLGI